MTLDRTENRPYKGGLNALDLYVTVLHDNGPFLNFEYKYIILPSILSIFLVSVLPQSSKSKIQVFQPNRNK